MFAREYLGRGEEEEKNKNSKTPADVLKDQPSTTRPYRACGASITTYINLVVESLLLRRIRTFLFFFLSLFLYPVLWLSVCTPPNHTVLPMP